MIELVPDDFRPLADFPLQWRWTNPQRVALPESVLAQMQPLTAAKAQELWQWLSVSNSELYYALFPSMAQREPLSLFSSITPLGTTMKNLSEVQDRLRILEPDDILPVLIFWESTEALLLPWQIFAGYLDDFCYPGGDVEAWSLTETWEFLYHHDDRAIFGKLHHPLPCERRVVTPVPPTHLDEIIRLVQANDLVAATKLYRIETGVRLKDALDEIKKMKKDWAG